MVILKVVDCRVCGDPHSVLRFAFVEFADERKLVVLGHNGFLIVLVNCVSILFSNYTDLLYLNRWCKSSIKPWWNYARLLSSEGLTFKDCYPSCESYIPTQGTSKNLLICLSYVNFYIMLWLHVWPFFLESILVMPYPLAWLPLHSFFFLI